MLLEQWCLIVRRSKERIKSKRRRNKMKLNNTLRNSVRKLRRLTEEGRRN